MKPFFATSPAIACDSFVWSVIICCANFLTCGSFEFFSAILLAAISVASDFDASSTNC
ncbi:hypothetical protein OKW33_004526 [Paraburkholderia atlantica]